MFNIFLRKQKTPQDLKEVSAYIRKLEEEIDSIDQELKALKEQSQIHIQKVGIVRFNPFRDVGGDQSFSIALLDANDMGIVITSLYGREGNRVYAKPIEHGQSKYQLSNEEREAIQRAKAIKL